MQRRLFPPPGAAAVGPSVVQEAEASAGIGIATQPASPAEASASWAARTHSRRWAVLGLLWATIGLLLAACQPAVAPAPTATIPPPAPTATAAPASPTATRAPSLATPTAAAVERVTLLLAAAQRQVEVRAELAITPQRRALGLMFREQLADGEGMLFIFPQDTTSGFWMQNTRVPLSIAFIDATGVIVGLDDMEPLSEEIHSPPGPYRCALEVPQGFFARQGVRVGDKVLFQDAGGPRPLTELPALAAAR